MIRIFDEKTGYPSVDNDNRARNKALWKVCRRGMKINTPRGRRRKKEILRVEMPRYMNLVKIMADHIAEERKSQKSS